jgi:hypothetical protein
VCEGACGRHPFSSPQITNHLFAALVQDFWAKLLLLNQRYQQGGFNFIRNGLKIGYQTDSYKRLIPWDSGKRPFVLNVWVRCEIKML